MGFSVILGFCFAAYCNYFYLTLHRDLWRFSSYMRTAEVAFGMMLNKFKFREIAETSTIAPIFFFCFSLTIAILLLNMLATILSDMFAEVSGAVSNSLVFHILWVDTAILNGCRLLIAAESPHLVKQNLYYVP